MRYFILLLFCFSLLLVGCQKKANHQINFYYWKTNVSIGKIEKEYFEKLNSQKLYIRFFDIDKEGSAISPKAKISLFDSKVLLTQYVPVVFITNRTFTNITQSEVDDLAKNVTDLIERIRVKNSIPEITEIQIDCDWTQSTKVAYFEFLKTLKTISSKEISCTLRLHQIKYRNTAGIPPVDQGCLMCYATSDPSDGSGNNSILDMVLLKNYTSDIGSYPLSFDVALPLYSWGIVTNHIGKIKLLNGITESDMDSVVFKKINTSLYEVQDDVFFRGFYLNKGFTIKIESITPDLLNEAKLYLDKKINRDYDIIYYHLDQLFLERFSIQELE